MAKVINYKDAISVTGKNRIIKCESLIPGLDFSGTVIESNSKNFSKGQKVLATGSGLGEVIDGGFTEYAYTGRWRANRGYRVIDTCLPMKIQLFSTHQRTLTRIY